MPRSKALHPHEQKARTDAEKRASLLFLMRFIAEAIEEGRFDRAWMSMSVRLVLMEAAFPTWKRLLESETGGVASAAAAQKWQRIISKYTRGAPFVGHDLSDALPTLHRFHGALTKLANPAAPSLPWLLALDQKWGDAATTAAGIRARAHWALQVHAGCLLAGESLAHRFGCAGSTSCGLTPTRIQPISTASPVPLAPLETQRGS